MKAREDLGESGFREAFADARDALGLTQEQLAVELGVTKTTIQNWESGRTEPRMVELRKVCVKFGWPIPWGRPKARKRASSRRPNPGWLNAAIGGTPEYPAEEPALAVG